MTEKELRELDAEVHRVVMGQSVWFELNVATGETRPHDGVPHYSTDIAAAWLVVEKMRERFSFGIWATPGHSSVQRGVRVVFAPSVYPPDRTNARGGVAAEEDAAPLAICLAALQS